MPQTFTFQAPDITNHYKNPPGGAPNQIEQNIRPKGSRERILLLIEQEAPMNRADCGQYGK